MNGTDFRTSLEIQPRIAIIYAVIVFSVTLAVDIAFRDIVLPYLFPGLHAGSGFMIGGDSLGFHEKAVAIAARIREYGWGEWQLRPFDTLDTPAGVAAALYAVFGSSPYVLLPFNAAVHAGSALCLLFILRPIVGGEVRHAMIATLPFVAFPTALYWHSQLHKDGMFILGIYLFLLGWLLSFRDTPNSWRRQLLAGFLIVCGAAVVWAVRQYILIVLAACALILTLLCGAFENLWRRQGRLPGREFAWRIFGRCTLCLAIASIGGPGKARPPGDYLRQYKSIVASGASMERVLAPLTPLSCPVWVPSTWVPPTVDRLAYSIASTRQGYLASAYSSAGSTIDRDRCLHSIPELVAYFPRALQISLFAPFPWQWIESASQGGGRAMRLVAGAEMLVAYVALLFAAIALWQRRMAASWLWPSIVFAMLLLLLLTYVTPNIGTLHRMRYGFYMIPVGIGFGFLSRRLFRWRVAGMPR